MKKLFVYFSIIIFIWIGISKNIQFNIIKKSYNQAMVYSANTHLYTFIIEIRLKKDMQKIDY